MKKFGMFCSALLLVACANIKETEEVQNNKVATAVPCSYSCQSNQATPCPYVQNVQKPRVTEIMPKKRPCCDDVNPNAKEVIPDAPEIYVIAANRTLRSMLNGDSPLPNNAKIFVAETVNNEPDLPTGFEKGTAALKRGLERSGKYNIVSERARADYVLIEEISWYDTATKTVPAIKYSLGLYNNYGQKLGDWNEILHQANGDRSWW